MKNKFISGIYKSHYQYKSFIPNFINKPYEIRDKKINIILEEAIHKIGEINAYSLLIPDVNFFIQMHITKEATTSSYIEGTKTKVKEALLPKEEIAPEHRDDWQEVQNYIKAMNYATGELKNLPLSMRLIKNTHKIILAGVRGKSKNPGEIRKTQNWIGGSSLKDAFFIPPHPTELPALLSDLEKFWHNKNLDIPTLLKIAVSHYQFETIHPFLDGNGRIGRLLITLQFMEKNFLSKPTLYISDFFAKHKGSYYDSLTLVRTTNNLDQWIKFFLNGIIKTSKSSIHTFEKIINLREQTEKKIISLGRRAKLGQQLLKILFSRPIVNVNQLSEKMKITFPTANALIKDFQKIEIFTEITRSKRNRLFSFNKYIDIFKE